MTGSNPARPEPGPDAGIGDLHADIEQTRQQLGTTVAALSDKFDVKQRARQTALETRNRIRDQRRPIVAALIGAGMLVGFVIWVRRR